MACYEGVPVTPILDKYLNPAGGDSLTVPKCQDSCYLAGYEFAGVQDGDQWCSSWAGGTTRNHEDCNIPCTGDSTTFCGGKGLLFVFRAEENGGPVSSISTVTSMSMGAGTSGSSTVAVAQTRSSSGAMRNMARR